ncbi:MAG: HlyC/CorC family transporter [Sphingomonadales bacterium]|nr:HlyC/CorC family transporter [Sphingomonadales bacterium]
MSTDKKSDKQPQQAQQEILQETLQRAHENAAPTGIVSWLRRTFFGGKGDPSLRESLEEIIEEHEDDGGGDKIGEDERSMLFNVLSYGSMRADDIMVPRVDIVAVDSVLPFDDLLGVFASAAHSRLPVYKENMDEIVGMVHVKDAVIALEGQQNSSNSQPTIENIMREVLIVAPSMKLMDLLAKMRAKRTHMAIVVDEYGGTDGLVTIENLVEQIVGDIEDEHDEDDRLVFVPVRPGVFDADARMPVEELESVLGYELLPEERDEDIETLGGVIVSIEGRVPQIGDVIEQRDGFKFEVLNGDARKIKKIRIYTPESK